jgi:uncharacterized protein
MEDGTNAKTRTLVTLTFSLLAFSVISFSALFAAGASAQDVPIPTLTPYVTDLAGVIEPQYEDAINAYASQLEASTTDEIAVLTVGSTQPMTIEEYAVRVFEKNGIGQKGKDNGVLVVAAIDDRRYWIEVGYGLEGVLNDAKVGRIGRAYLSAYFVDGRYGEGTYLAVRAIGDAIVGNSTASDSGYDYIDTTGLQTVFAVMAALIAISVASAVLSMRCPKCGSWQMRAETKGDNVCRVCKKCGYRKCRKRDRLFPFFMFVGSGGGGHGGGFSGGGGFGGGGSGGGGSGGGW